MCLPGKLRSFSQILFVKGTYMGQDKDIFVETVAEGSCLKFKNKKYM